MRECLGGESYMLAAGILILLSTCPVCVLAIFNSPSVPAEKSFSPSGLKARLRQLPLCRRVRHCVSIVPQPMLNAEESASAPPFSDGRRKVWTCPDARPTEIRGSVGWMAWVKRSDGRG